MTNMGKDVAGGKVESSILLDNGDGNGGKRRDVMHQVAGVPLGAGDVYVNHPIGEIYYDALNAYTMLSIGRMQDIRLTGEKALGFDPKNAIPDIGRNFSPAEMTYREAPNGKHWEHKTGYRFHQILDGEVVAYDRRGERIGSYATPEQAMLAGKQKLQKQQQAMHEVAQDVKAAYDRGVHFSPREEYGRQKATEELHARGFAGKFRAEYVEMLRSLTEEYNAKINNPQVDPRLLNGIRNKMELIPRILEKIDSKADLFSEDSVTLIQHAGIPARLDGGFRSNSGGQAWMSMRTGGIDAHMKGWDKIYPMTFRSALNDRIQVMLRDTPNMTPQQLRKRLLQYGSRTGERLWAEAEAVGFVDWLESKIQPTYRLTRRYDAATGSILPRGEEYSPIATPKGEKMVTLDPNEISDFIKNNGISVTIDTGARERWGTDTSQYTHGGTRSEYNETAIRIDQDQYRHPVEGHYNRALLHTRKTSRFDADGNKYVYTEEIQRQNAEGKPKKDALTPIEISNFKNTIAVLKKKANTYEAIEKHFREKYGFNEGEYKNAFNLLHSAGGHAQGVSYTLHTLLDSLASDKSKNKISESIASDIESLILKNPELINELLSNSHRYSPEGEYFRLESDIERQGITIQWDNRRTTPVMDGEFFAELIKENPDIFKKVAEYRKSRMGGTNNNPFGDPLKALDTFKLTYQGKPLSKDVLFGDITTAGFKGDFNRLSYSGNNTPLTLVDILGRIYLDFASEVKEAIKVDTDAEQKSINAVDSAFPEYSVLRRDRKNLTDSYENYLKRISKIEGEDKTDALGNRLDRLSRDAWELRSIITNYVGDHGTATGKARAVYRSYLESKRTAYAESIHGEDGISPQDVARMRQSYNEAYADVFPQDQGVISFREDTLGQTKININDLESKIQRHEAAKRNPTGYPLESMKDTSLLALKELIAFTIRAGTDNLVLTHPDDAPTVSMMEYEARHGLYGDKGIPAVWGGFLQKYGIKVHGYDSTERFLGGLDVSKIPEVKQSFKTLSDSANETFAKCKVLLDLYESGGAGAITSDNVNFVSQTTSRPVHEIKTPRQGQQDFEGQVKQTIKSLNNRVKKGEVPSAFLDAYADAIESKRAESKAFEAMVDGIIVEQTKSNSGKQMGRDEIITAMALSRGKHIVLNDALKKDIMSGKAMTTYSVAETDSRGGRRYDPFGHAFQRTFIGKYFNDNKDTLPKGMTVEFKNTHRSVGDPQYGFTLEVKQGFHKSGKPNFIANIHINVDGNKASVESTGVAESMRGKKLNNVLMSEAAERLRSQGVKYLDGVIIDPENRPYHARMRTIGNAESLGNGGYYDVTRSTLDKNAYYSPEEKELKGRIQSSSSLTELSSWLSELRGSVKSWHEVEMTQNVKDIADNLDVFTSASKDDMMIALEKASRSDSVSKQIYSDVVEGKTSLTEATKKLRWEGDYYTYNYELNNIRSERKNLAKRVQEVMGNKRTVKDTDARRSNTGAERESRNTGYYSVNENDKGGQTYNQKSLKWKKGFIGRYAGENPEMSKELKLTFETEKASASRGMAVMAGRVAGKSTHNHYLQITEAGKEVGHITWKTQIGAKDGRKIFSDPSVSVEPAYRGKNYQHLLYSEAAERARAMGATDFFQRIENDLGLPLKSQVKTFGENYSKLLDQYSGQYMPATMDNFNKLKYPEMEIHNTEADGTVNIEKHKGHELWVYAWSKIQSDKWYSLNERDMLVLRKSEDMPWFKKAMASAGGFVRYATAEDLNNLRGLRAISHAPDTLTGTDITTAEGRVVAEGAGGLPYPMLQAERGSNAAWASQGEGFVNLTNNAIRANRDAGKGVTAIMPLTFTSYEKARASVQGSEFYYNVFDIFKRGKIVSEKDLRLAMLEAVEKVDRPERTVKDAEGKVVIDETTGKPKKEVVIEPRQKDALKKIVSDNKANWDEMLAGVMLTLDDSNIQNFGTRAPMMDDFMGAVWDRVMKGLSDKKKQEVMRFFPEWDGSKTAGEFSLANLKSTMGNTLADSLTKGLKSGDVYAIIKFNDFVESMDSGHRSYNTGIVQKNGQKPEVLLLKRPINVLDLHETSISANSGERKLSDLPSNVQTNLLGMNSNPYGATRTKAVGQVDYRDMMANYSVQEKFAEKVAPNGKVLQAINGYIIMIQGDKFKVYNSQKVQVGIYASEQEAKKRALRN